MAYPPSTIAQLYKARWRIELFFKWIKQHLRIKAFYGTSLNAVKTQIWIAITTYMLIAILKKELGIEHSLYTMLQVLSVTLFEKTPLLQAFADSRYTPENIESHNQCRYSSNVGTVVLIYKLRDLRYVLQIPYDLRLVMYATSLGM